MSNNPTPTEKDIANISATNQRIAATNKSINTKATIALGVSIWQLGVQRGILKQAKISNVQLAAIAATNADIAASNRRIEDFNKETLDQSKRQTAIMELQLEESKLAKLEKICQIQLKQGAFSLNKDIDAIIVYPLMERILLLKRKCDEAQFVHLNADELHEISDKEYTHTVISRLHTSIEEAEKSISQNERNEINEFGAAVDFIQSHPFHIEEFNKQIAQLNSKKDEKLKTLKEALRNLTMKQKLTHFFVGVILLFIGCMMLANHKIVGSLILLLGIGFLGTIFGPGKSKELIKVLEDEIVIISKQVEDVTNQQQTLNTQLENIKQALESICSKYPMLRHLTA